MQFPDFHEFEAYLRAVEPELKQLASRGKLYQLKDKDPLCFRVRHGDPDVSRCKRYGYGVPCSVSSVSGGLL